MFFGGAANSGMPGCRAALESRGQSYGIFPERIITFELNTITNVTENLNKGIINKKMPPIIMTGGMDSLCLEYDYSLGSRMMSMTIASAEALVMVYWVLAVTGMAAIW